MLPKATLKKIIKKMIPGYRVEDAVVEAIDKELEDFLRETLELSLKITKLRNRKTLRLDDLQLGNRMR